MNDQLSTTKPHTREQRHLWIKRRAARLYAFYGPDGVAPTRGLAPSIVKRLLLRAAIQDHQAFFGSQS